MKLAVKMPKPKVLKLKKKPTITEEDMELLCDVSNCFSFREELRNFSETFEDNQPECVTVEGNELDPLDELDNVEALEHLKELEKKGFVISWGHTYPIMLKFVVLMGKLDKMKGK